MEQPPIINVNPIQAKPVQVATPEHVADYSAVKQVNSIAAGLCIGLIFAAYIGPTMLMGACGCIACGIALGGLCGNLNRNAVDCVLFLLLLLFSFGVAYVGYERMALISKTLNEIKF